MKWNDLLDLLGDEPLFESSQLLAGPDLPHEVSRQLSRWVAAGRIIQLRRGLYAIARPHAKAVPAPLTIATRLRHPSYVSLESALEYHGLIPESVPMVTSVTTSRPGKVTTPLGVFSYRHLQVPLFWGYEHVEIGPRQSGLVAFPEKALLDLIYLTPGRMTRAYLAELRLQGSEGIDLRRLIVIAERTGKPKLIRAAAIAAAFLESEAGEESEL